MNSLLLGRSLGSEGPQALQRAESARLLNCIHAVPYFKFDGRDDVTGDHGHGARGTSTSFVAHPTGVNCLTIDKFEGR